jgi:ABC-type Fe3+ transport system permease subunit
VLPLAVPAYVMAYVYTDFLQFVGPVQTTLRETFGWAARRLLVSRTSAPCRVRS